MDAGEFDYVIVGAGSAGCVLANRLSEDGSSRVLVIEAGGGDRSILIRMPSALSIPMGMARYGWGYASEPEPFLDGRRIAAPRGRLLGGSSSINGMVWVRGHALDFERWEEEGARGWGYADVLPYFRRAEARAEGADAWRGADGALATRAGALANPLYRAFIEAGRQAGYPVSDDLNGFRQEGFGRLDMTVRNGERWSAARAFLDPALARPNLELRKNALATRVVFEGRRAVAISFRQDGVERLARVRREVALCGGAFNSPQLLMLSGIGPAADLARLGLPVVHDLPGVGANLQDHLEFYFQLASKAPVTLYRATGLLARAAIGLRWLATRGGLGATNHFEAGGFIRSRAGVRHPDIQFHFLPLAVSYDGSSLASEHGFQAHVGTLRSKSRGRVALASPDPADKPRLFFNYMSHPDDWTEMRAALGLTREIFARPAMAPFVRSELSPGPGVAGEAEVDAFLRQRLESAYHPCGTCRMGRPDDELAVVDPHTRVIGVEALRVVDASIMPSVTSGNLNAPTIMLAEKAADHIRGLAPLAPSNAPFHVAADWETRQR